MSAEELKELLRRDQSAGIDQNGRLFYSDPIPANLPSEAAASEPLSINGAVIALADTFILHSKPGSKRVIFLDFDGHTISGTVWNDHYNGGQDIVAPAWDIEGGPLVFTETERLRIQQIWKRVTEDFAPFDVDVTTEYLGEAVMTRSSSSDEQFGVRVLVSAISSYVGAYGGAAYYGFNSVGDYYKPALVFPENLGNGEKAVAECISHEAGHSLGLSHDGTTLGDEYYLGHGTGETGWAPIMGSGYYKNVTQWSRGEYPDANNTQDDFAVMQTWGVSLRTDDVGNSIGTASFLPAGASVAAGALIERSSDVDVIGFVTDAGTISLSLNPASLGPNLDVSLRLLDPAGQLIAASAPANLLAASVSASVAAGTYYVEVKGTGNGDLTTGYSAYGSVGQYTLTANVIDPTGHVAPIAVASATPNSGQAPLPVQFSSSGSADLDGSIVGWLWDFGDGTTSTTANPSHTYATAGSYTATLTVTDNSGLTDSATVEVTASGLDLAKVLRVASISLSVVTTSRDKQVRAIVRITDALGNPVSGVAVTSQFSGVAASTGTGTTDASGLVTLNSKRFRKSGSVTATVTAVSKSGFTYDPARDVVSSAIINVP